MKLGKVSAKEITQNHGHLLHGCLHRFLRGALLHPLLLPMSTHCEDPVSLQWGVPLDRLLRTRYSDLIQVPEIFCIRHMLLVGVLGFSLRQARQRTATRIKPTGLLSSISHATLIPSALCHFNWKTSLLSSYHAHKCSRPKLGFPELGPSLWQV